MKNPLRNIFTIDEQKIILFLLFFAFVGLSIKFTLSDIDAQENSADSLDFSKDFQVIYDLRTVTAKELETISGIGPKRAATIIGYRNDFGFNSLDELLKVKGIGKATYKKYEKYFLEFGENNSSKEKPTFQKDLSIVNINKADAKELTLIPGIGPSKAERIINKRKELIQFTSIEQLLEVKGIGEKTLEKMKANITLGENK